MSSYLGVFWRDEVLRISVGLVLVGCVWIGAMLAAAQLAPTLAGWVAVAGASFIFGASGVSMKSPTLLNVQPNPLLFGLFVSLGILLVSLPLLAYLLAVRSFRFVPWAVLGSADIVLISLLAFQAVQLLGYAKAPAVWASVGMVTAFVQGAVAFREPIRQPALAFCSLPILIAGVCLVLLSQGEGKDGGEEGEENGEGDVELLATNPLHQPTTSQHRDSAKETAGISTSTSSLLSAGNGQSQAESCDASDYSTGKYTGHDDEHRDSNRSNITSHHHDHKHSRSHRDKNYNNSNKTDDTDSEGQRNNRQSVSSLSSAAMLWGLSLCLLTGLCDGSLVTPYKIARQFNSSLEPTLYTFTYLASFGLGALCCLPFVSLSIYLSSSTDTSLLRQQVLCFAPAGLLNGVLWAMANVLSVHGTRYLGMKIGFPLTQTCVLFNTMWGVCYFKEVSLGDRKVVLKLLGGVLLVIVGSICLALSG